MSTLPIQKTVIAKDATVKGNFVTLDDGSIAFTVYAGESREVEFRFSLPRSTLTAKGLRIKSLETTYKLNSGNLTSISTSLTQILHEADAVKLYTLVATTSDTFVLTPSSTLFRKTATAVDSPVWDNQSSNISVAYLFTLTFIASSDCAIELRGAEIMYDLSEISDGSIEADTITALTTNTDLSLSGNGTGNVILGPVVNVSQITSITTGVTTNGQSGVITTMTASTAANSVDTFTVTNSKAKITSIIMLTINGYSGTLATNGLPMVSVSNRTNGTFDINVANAHSTNTLNGTLDIAYIIM